MGDMLKFTQEDGSLCRPGFINVAHMDEVMVARWNEVVKPEDKVYHCGDFCFSNKILNYIAPRLNGKKRLLLGNHDTLDMGAYTKHFQKIGMWRQFVAPEGDVALVLTHVPIHTGSFIYRFEEACVNVHGHIHNKTLEGPYLNVCVEHTDYRPVRLAELFSRARAKLADLRDRGGEHHQAGR